MDDRTSIGRKLADHFRQVHFGGNWTTVNLQDQLTDTTWQQSIYRCGELHTIAELAFHIHFFVAAVLNVFRGNPLDAHDRFSFDCPAIESAEDWEKLRHRIFEDAKEFASHVEKFSDDHFDSLFADEKYGTVYRNIQGIIEHSHYHLGQLVIVKKLAEQHCQSD